MMRTVREVPVSSQHKFIQEMTYSAPEGHLFTYNACCSRERASGERSESEPPAYRGPLCGLYVTAGTLSVRNKNVMTLCSVLSFVCNQFLKHHLITKTSVTRAVNFLCRAPD